MGRRRRLQREHRRRGGCCDVALEDTSARAGVRRAVGVAAPVKAGGVGRTGGRTEPTGCDEFLAGCEAKVLGQPPPDFTKRLFHAAPLAQEPQERLVVE